MSQNNNKGLQRELISGFSSGVFTILATHPLDVIKLRLQLSRESHSSYKSIIKQTLSLPTEGKKNRFLQFYKGLGINLVGNSTSWGMYFFFYRYYKDLLSPLSSSNSTAYQRDKKMTSFDYLSAAWGAGFTTSFLTMPLWVVKTRVISINNHEKHTISTSYSKTIKQIYRTEGLKAFFRGLVPSIIGVSQGAIYFSIYDTLKMKMFIHEKERSLSAFETISITSISKMIATLLLYPIQTLKTNMQDHGMQNRNMIQTIKTIYNRNLGIKHFYKGITANLARSIPATCITFYTYETVKDMI